MAMAVSKVQLFSLPVSDQSRSRDFYVDKLGFELVADTDMGPTQRWVRVRPRGSETSITLVTWFESMAPGSSKGTVLESDDVDADIALFKERGVDIAGEVQEAPWGRFVTFEDPDGNCIVLQETAGPQA
jgi:catechol 2,3-dioxygenase-like lactoylglutathione lyase family enzyme